MGKDCFKESAKLTMKVLDRSTADIWDNFVDANEWGMPFHLHEWLVLCERHQKAELIKLGFYDDQELVGILPIFKKRIFLLKVSSSPIVVEDSPYMGPLIKAEKFLPQVMHHIDNFMKKSQLQFFRFITRQKINVSVLERYGYRHISRHTHILDLQQGIDTLWKKLEGRARTAIRKAESLGVRVSIVDGLEYIEKYYELYKKLYSRQKKAAPNDKNFFYSLFKGNLACMTKLVVAYVDKMICAAAILVHYKGCVFYIDAVTDKMLNKNNGSSAIQWHIISWAVNSGFKYYDFVGSDLPWLAKFKASFGGRLEEYSLFEKASSDWVFFLRELYGAKLKPAFQRVYSHFR